MATTKNCFTPLIGLGNNTQPSNKRKKTDDIRVRRLGFRAGEDELISANEKYLVMKHADDQCNLSKLSPFGIQKALEMITTGIIKTQRTRAGELLILAKNGVAASALLKATKLGQLAQVNVIEHPTLNSSKGIIFSRDLMELTEEEIQKGLKDQGVVEVKRMKRWVDKTLKDTAALILTFNTPALPDHVKAGFLKLNVRIYIPNPMKCTTCLKFGHTKKRCNSTTQICIKCSEALPHEKECTIHKCVNCQQGHPSNSKQCPVYQREAEIIKIKTTDRLTFYEAKTKYFRMYANTTPATNNTVSFAETLKKSIEIQPKQPEQITQTEKSQNEAQQKPQQQQPYQQQQQTKHQEKQQSTEQGKQAEQEKQPKLHQSSQNQLQQQKPTPKEQHYQQQAKQPKETTTNTLSMDVETTMNHFIFNKKCLLSEAELALMQNNTYP